MGGDKAITLEEIKNEAVDLVRTDTSFLFSCLFRLLFSCVLCLVAEKFN